MSGRRSRTITTLSVGAVVIVAALLGCDNFDGAEGPMRDSRCLSFPSNETAGLTPEYYAAVPSRESAGQIRYFVEHEEAALRELAGCGLDGVRSRYSAADIEEMRTLLMGTPPEKWGDNAAFGFHVDPEDDVFEVRGQLDESHLAEVLEGYTYRYVQIEDVTPRSG